VDEDGLCVEEGSLAIGEGSLAMGEGSLAMEGDLLPTYLTMWPLNRDSRVRNMIRLPAAPPNQQPLVPPTIQPEAPEPWQIPITRFHHDSIDLSRPRSIEFIESFEAATNPSNQLDYLNLHFTVLNAQYQDEPSHRDRILRYHI
jgi:hypothetical protein